MHAIGPPPKKWNTHVLQWIGCIMLKVKWKIISNIYIYIFNIYIYIPWNFMYPAVEYQVRAPTYKFKSCCASMFLASSSSNSYQLTSCHANYWRWLFHCATSATHTIEHWLCTHTINYIIVAILLVGKYAIDFKTWATTRASQLTIPSSV